MWYLLFPPWVLGDDRGGANREGPTLHVGQQALLHQVRSLEPHVAIHLQQLVDLCGEEVDNMRGALGIHDLDFICYQETL